MAAAEDSGDTDLLALPTSGEKFVNRKFVCAGGYNVVFSADCTLTNRPVALKIAQPLYKDLANEFLRKEIDFLRVHKHNNIIGLLGWFCEDDCVSAVLELAKWVLVPGWTRKEWNGGKPVITNAVRVLHGIADGMKFLHGCLDSQSKPALHLDLKPSNILVMEDDTPKLADFGSYERSKYSDKSTKTLLRKPEDAIYSTLSYAPPERHEHKTSPSRRYDVYSYGIVMWEVLSYGQEPPYGNADDKTIIKTVMKGGRPNCKRLHPETPQHLQDLMKECWAQKFSDRPRFDKIVERIKSILDSFACSRNDMGPANDSSADDSSCESAAEVADETARVAQPTEGSTTIQVGEEIKMDEVKEAVEKEEAAAATATAAEMVATVNVKGSDEEVYVNQILLSQEMITMSTVRLEPKMIRYSQSSITGRFHQDKNICDVKSAFREDVYDKNEFIKVVRYTPEAFTSYDNRRLYWGREQPTISCIVIDAGTCCLEDGGLGILYWESESDNDNGSPKRLHKATVLARDYSAWVALKCSRQGQDFPLCGRLQLPSISDCSTSLGSTIYRLCTSMKPTGGARETSDSNRELQEHLATKGSIYVSMPNGTLLYLNKDWQAFLEGDGFANHFECVSYETYLNICIKTLDPDKKKWDRADREAYDLEVQGLTELNDICSEDSDDAATSSSSLHLGITSPGTLELPAAAAAAVPSAPSPSGATTLPTAQVDDHADRLDRSSLSLRTDKEAAATSKGTQKRRATDICWSFRKARTILTQGLTKADVLCITCSLYAEELITISQKEEIQMKADGNIPSETVRYLMDIVFKRGEEAVLSLLNALESVGRKDLAATVRDMKV